MLTAFSIDELFAQAIEDDNENLLFQYGPEDGDPLFLTELAKFLTAEYGAPVDRYVINYFLMVSLFLLF